MAKSQKDDKYHCLILMDIASSANDKYRAFLSHNKKLTDKALFNIVDVNIMENKWLEQWLSPMTIPVTCVFNPSGKLINLIGGCTYESTSLLKENIVNERDVDEYMYPNRFNLKKREIISVMGKTLECKLKLDNKENISDDIQDVLSVLKYPYNLSLKLENELKLGLDSLAIRTSKDILSLKNSYNILLFHDLFFTAEQVADTNYNIKKAQNIEIISDSINLGDCIKGETYLFDISIKNKGYYPLTIYEVYSGCGCLAYLGDRVTIPMQETVKLSFKFVPEVKGNVFRTAYIISDSRSNNFEELKIYAFVK